MKYAVRSLLVLFALYALVFAIGDAYLARLNAPLWSAVAFAIGLVGFQYLASPWIIEWFFTIIWDDYADRLPAANRQFLETLCKQQGLKVPRIGVIPSGTPNAFSFGWLRRDARIVITQGLLDVLTPEEANAVLAHELGHIEHFDFVVITIAALVPLLLYQIYAFTRNQNNTRVIAYGAYLCYLVSQYIVLFLNRTREYFADDYAAVVTGHPAELSSALVKIAYGLVKAEGEYKEALNRKSKADKSTARKEHRLGGAIALMGVCNVRSGAALALGQSNPEQAAAIMRWDLVNPWARVYEMGSTHPLTALRIRALNERAPKDKESVTYPLPQDHAIRWGRFPIEFLIWAAPWICLFLLLADGFFRSTLAKVHIVVGGSWSPALLVALGFSWIVRVFYRYRGEWTEEPISALLGDVDVTPMSPRAVRLRGEVVGRGVPGAFWSPDLVLRDETGIIFLQYRQTVPFARFLFAIGGAERYIGQQVTVEGWFRRAPMPYVEMSRIGDAERTARSYSRWVQMALAIGAILAGYLRMTH